MRAMVPSRRSWMPRKPEHYRWWREQNVFLSVAYVGNKGSRLPSSLNPVNVLNPFDAKIQAFYANTTPIDASCATGNPTPGANCSYVSELDVPYPPANPTLLGANPPYPRRHRQLHA